MDVKGDRRGVLRAVAGFCALAGLVTLTACASPATAVSPAVPAATLSAAPGSAQGVAAAGAPVPIASGVASGAGQSPRPTGKARPEKSPSSSLPAVGAAGGAPVIAGNPSGHAVVPAAAQAVPVSRPDHVIGSGTPGSCTSAAVVAAVAAGGVITFDCGPGPVTITMTATATVPKSAGQVVIDGGGKVTLSGGGSTEILSMNAGWQQASPSLVVQNLAFTDAYSATQQAAGSSVYGGGAIFAYGGQLKVVNSAFTGNSCFSTGPDLGGGAIRAVGMSTASPVYITGDTFTGNSCSNGGALSGLFAHFEVLNCLMTGNKAIGIGANPAKAGTPGGGSGGAIYTDGTGYDLTVSGTVMRDNSAREGGGAIFFVVNSGGGTLTIDGSALSGNPSAAFQNAPGIFDSVNGKDTPPVETGGSTVS
jgi:hypothetical protein